MSVRGRGREKRNALRFPLVSYRLKSRCTGINPGLRNETGFPVIGYHYRLPVPEYRLPGVNRIGQTDPGLLNSIPDRPG